MKKYIMKISLSNDEIEMLGEEFAKGEKTIQEVLDNMVKNTIRVQIDQWLRDIAKTKFEKMSPTEVYKKLKDS